ncbi:hypothetical protein U1E44_01470 [Arenibacter sp. GZD96]|nr:hypothetical protein [Arenibacter sp. GZD-96]MEA1784748.1 hypothetical protein [Arenibacter sp. GZD-96]
MKKEPSTTKVMWHHYAQSNEIDYFYDETESAMLQTGTFGIEANRKIKK